MKTKFKQGDWVEVLDSKHLRMWHRWREAVGFRFEIKTKNIYQEGRIYLDGKNTFGINYLATDLKLVKMTTRKKATEEKIVLHDGDYYSATMGRKKIRGIVYEDEYSDEFILGNSQGAGVETDCGGDFMEFPYFIGLEAGATGTEKDLAAAGVKNFKVLGDKRQKAIIDKDKMPQFVVTSWGRYTVAYKDGKLVFGCGAVSLTQEQIEGYLACREVVSRIRELEEQGCDLSDYSLEELEEYIKLKKQKLDVKKQKLYDEVIEAVDSYHTEDDINDIDEAEIRQLFKYAEHVEAGV